MENNSVTAPDHVFVEVSIATGGSDRYRIPIKQHWRVLPDNEGFILFRNAISVACGAAVNQIRDTDDTIVLSLDVLSNGDTLKVGKETILPLSPQSSLSSLSTGNCAMQHEQGSILERLNSLENKISRVPVSPNLIKNSLLSSETIGEQPSGYTKLTWRAGGSITCSAVHPFTHGFEGSYTETAPTNSVTPETCHLADANKPVFYGRYNMGPRLSRGGLSTGWQTIGNGRILKLTGNRIDQHEIGVNIPCLPICAVSKIRVVAWVKCVKGCVRFDIDYAFWNQPGKGIQGTRKKGCVRREDCVSEPQGWFKLDDVCPTSNITRFEGGHGLLLRCFGPSESDGLGDFEIYIALPYVSIVEDGAKVSIVPYIKEW